MARRRHLIILVACAFAGVLAAPSGASAATCAGQDLPPTAEAAQLRASVLCLVNVARTTRGLPALAQDDRLQGAAQAFALQMVAQDFFDHVAPDGTDPGRRITAAGFAWSSYGENIAFGQRTPLEVVTAWMASAGHCRNILSPNVTLLGVGVTPARTSGGMWVQDFALPRGATAATSNSAPQGSCPQGGIEGPAAAAVPTTPATTTTITPAATQPTAKPKRHQHKKHHRPHRRATIKIS